MTFQDSQQAKIFSRLENANFRSEDELNRLFTQILGYTFVPRNDQLIPWNRWTEPAREGLDGPPRRLFRAGTDDKFSVIYCKLKGESLLVGQERRAISQLQSKNNVERGLFIFSTESQSRWHFVNVRYEADEKRRPLQRRITIGPEERHRTASERIAKLTLEGDEAARLSDLEIQNRHNDAFDVEQVTKKFFEDYQKVYFDLQDDLIGQTDDRRWAHDYSLQFINRMMFLYFVQRKRWLGDDPGFVKKFWNAYRLSDKPRDSFFSDWLKVLFFEAFNGKFHGGRRYFPPEIREVLALAPYLNGGLFTENDLDTRHTFDIFDARFEKVLNLLEHYNFTISEDSPLDQEVAVDPEMIGKVYESLVNVEETAADERSAAGIFYTPRTEIDLMCRLTVVDHLANHLGDKRKNLLYEVVFAIEPEDKDAADRQVSEAGLWQELDNRLKNITTVDPACGSGSFLVGMLQVLDDLLQRSARQLGREEDPYERRKEIIGQSLYGVDVMDWAVRVAELRLWLSLIVETDFTRDELHLREEPLLPHFTFKLRPGDGLVQEVGGVNLGHMRSGLSLPSTVKRKITTLKNEKLKFYNNDPERRFRTAYQLQQEERRLFIEILDTRSQQIQNRIADLNHRIANPAEELQLEGMSESKNRQLDLQTVALQKEMDGLEEERNRLDLARQAIRPDRPVPFVWDIAFVEIFEGEDRGFDIVVGNPPYVSSGKIADPHLAPEDVTTENKKGYKAKLARSVYQMYPDFFRYNIAGDRSARPLNGKSDLYVYFFFHGLSLLNQNGSFSFITSNSWLDVEYGEDLREFLLNHSHVKMILDNTKRSFASADVNTVIALFSPPNETQNLASGKLARFVMFTVPFEHILDPVIFEEIEYWNDRTTTQEYRVHPIDQQVLLQDGANVFAEENIVGSSNTPINLTGYLGNKWGGKYLRASDIYWTIFQRTYGKMIPLGNLVDYKYGIKPGAVKFFYLSEQRADEWEIEREFLKPIISSSQSQASFSISPDKLLFYCSESRSNLDGSGALRYIEWGEEEGFHNGTAVRSHHPYWYSLHGEPIDFLLLQFWDKRFFTPLARENVFCSNNFFYGKSRNFDFYTSAGLLNSTFHFLQIEIMGRANQGQGVLNTYGPDFAWIKSLHPEHCDEVSLREAFDTLSARPVVSIFDEVQRKDRHALDNIIFDALDLTQGERDAVYEAVIDLVETRLKKASSLNQREASS